MGSLFFFFLDTFGAPYSTRTSINLEGFVQSDLGGTYQQYCQRLFPAPVVREIAQRCNS